MGQTEAKQHQVTPSLCGVCLFTAIMFGGGCAAGRGHGLMMNLNFQNWYERGVLLLFRLQMFFAPQRRGLFDISTSKSGPRMVCFVHFDFEMCFAPQRRAIFHLSSGQLAPHRPL